MSGDEKNVAIGAGVGVSLGAFSVTMLGAGFLWGRRKSKAKYEALKQAIPEGQYTQGPVHLAGPRPIYEASDSSAPIRSELPVSK